MHSIAQEQAIDDPKWDVAREGYTAGRWPGAPFDALPPDCLVTPLGVFGKSSFFMDPLGQFLSFESMKPADLQVLFRSVPNFVHWAWPRRKDIVNAESGAMTFIVTGIEEKKAIMCLQKAAAARGPFDPANRLRGRGAWRDTFGRLIWHSGEALWMVDHGKLTASRPGEVDGIFYFRGAGIMTPWPEPVPPSASPARQIFDMLKTWNWGRPDLDPVLVLGGIGVMFVCGALKDRPHVAAMGDFGTGKTALTDLIEGLLGDVLVRSENTTEAGVRQHMGLDALPVALDEFEASADNSRVIKIIELARVSYSGGNITRGGSDHKGVRFTARNAFFCSGINLPPMGPQDLSRYAIVNTNRLKLKPDSERPKASKDWGRQILRSIMDQWHLWEAMLADWRSVLAGASLTGRGQDTYGTLFAMAQLLLGAEDMEAIGLDITEPSRLGIQIAEATAEERALQNENWRECLDHLIGAPIEAIKGGTRPTIGGVTTQLEREYGDASEHDVDNAKEACAMAGCGLIAEPNPEGPAGKKTRWLLAVPPDGPLISKIFLGTKFQQGGWYRALKQEGTGTIVRKDSKVVKINRAPKRCLLIDLGAYDRATEE